MNPITTENHQADIFGRAIDCHADDLSPDVARFIIALKLAAEDEQRMGELAESARQGQLAMSEEAELEEFRRCGRMIEILKLKARKVLPKQ